MIKYNTGWIPAKDWEKGSIPIIIKKENSMPKNWVQIGGIAAIVIGSVALYFSGTAESAVVGLVAGVFVLAGVIAGLLKKEE